MKVDQALLCMLVANNHVELCQLKFYCFNSSHWEVRTLGYEIMNAAVQNDELVVSQYFNIIMYIMHAYTVMPASAILPYTYWRTVDGIRLIMQLLNQFIIMNHFGEKVRLNFM